MSVGYFLTRGMNERIFASGVSQTGEDGVVSARSPKCWLWRERGTLGRVQVTWRTCRGTAGSSIWVEGRVSAGADGTA